MIDSSDARGELERAARHLRPEFEVQRNSRWPFPYADVRHGQLDRQHWIGMGLGFAILHLVALQVSIYTGNFDPNPNHDHDQYMWEVLERGYPEPFLWPPGFSYYLALKWIVAQWLGVPYWTTKYFIDVFPVVAAGVLSVMLGQALTRNRLIAVVSGFGLIGAPIFILLVAEEGAAIFFQPFFLLALLILIRALQRPERRVVYSALAGAVMGLSCLIRANPQFILVVIGPFVYWLLRKYRVARPGRKSLALLAAFLITQSIIMLPWSLMQRNAGQDGLVPFGGIYRAYYKGLTRHPGNRISDWMNENYSQRVLSLGGVVNFNLDWMGEDPVALGELYLLKLVRAWYMSDSGRWDIPILLLHLPIWIVALAGLWFWRRQSRGDPAYVFLLLVIGYMWIVSAALDGIARYLAPTYGFVNVFTGVLICSLLRLHHRRIALDEPMKELGRYQTMP